MSIVYLKKKMQTSYEFPFAMFCLVNLVVPYFTGPVMMMNEKRLERWGWLPPSDIEDDDRVRMAHDKRNPEELHFV